MNLQSELRKQALKNYAFNYYLRKGIHLDVKKLLTKLSEQEEPESLTREELQAAIPSPGTYWKDISFVVHFYMAVGEPVTLQQIGHLEAIKRHAENEIYPRFKDQIGNNIRLKNIGSGPYSDDFERSYNFGDVSFMHGGATLKGRFEGHIKWEGSVQVFSGKANFEYSDIFSDPLSLIEKITGDSNDPDVPYLLRHFANLTGTPYAITGKWDAELYGIVDRRLSR